MLYPVYVHKDSDSAYGMTFPDFEGCYSAADTLQDIQRMAQEAVEVYFDGETMAIPKPSTPDHWVCDDRFKDGFWMLLDIDLSKVAGKTKRINISMNESLIQEIDKAAKLKKQSRSAFLAEGAERLLHS